MDERRLFAVSLLAGFVAFLFMARARASEAIAQSSDYVFTPPAPSPTDWTEYTPQTTLPSYYGDLPTQFDAGYVPVTTTPEYYGSIMPITSEQPPGDNVAAFLALIRAAESNGNYAAIQGGDSFFQFDWHPFDFKAGAPPRQKLGTSTASGAYQMVIGTWLAAKNALGLTDFTPESQDAAAIWILQYKRPRSWPYVQRGNVKAAMQVLQNEWEAFQKILAGTYPITIARAEQIYADNGGTVV